MCWGAAPGTLEVSFLVRMCPCGADVVSGWDEPARSRAVFLRTLPFPLPQIAAMESFLQHINKQVRQGEEQESLVAAARRIGPYEVLEPSSEEVEKVRETEGRGLRESKVPRPGGRGAEVPRALGVAVVPSSWAGGEGQGAGPGASLGG